MAAQNKPAGVRVNALNLADRYLKALGWPSTPTSRRVLAAWFMRESPRVPGSATDIYVIGNNPLNMACFSNCTNYWLAGGGSHKIIIYPSEASSIQTFGAQLARGNHGYDKIQNAFKSGADPLTIIKAINNSGWVTGKTGGHSYIYRKDGKLINGLLSTYNGLGNHDLTDTSLTDTQSQLAKIGISTDPNHQITPEEAKKLVEAWYPTLSGDLKTQTIAKFTGMKVQDIMTASDSGSSIGIGATDPITGLANAISGFQIFGALAGKALGLGAVLLGGGLIIFGAVVVAKDTYSSDGTGGGMLDVTPIIVKG